MLMCVALTGGAIVTACGSDNGGSSSSGGSSGGSQETGATKGAKVIDVSSMKNAKGSVTYCQGKDTSGNAIEGVKQFNKLNNGVTVKLLEFSTSADEQRSQFIQRQQAKSGECDIFNSDVIWTAEFASQKWIYDMTPYVNSRKSEIIPATLQTATYDGKIWGMPQTTDAAFLYYRDDQIKTPPATWQQVYQEAKANKGIVYQGAPYEGLTCDFLELGYAAGGQVLSADGKKSAFNSPQNVKALQLMVSGIKQGAAPKAVTTYMEPETDQAWTSGRYGFMRNWTYAYAADQTGDSKVKGKYKVAPLPSFQGGGKAGILGGHNSVISVFTKSPGLALKFA